MKEEFENMYFHGLKGNIITYNSDEITINGSLQQLESIILTGGLYSRNKLANYNIKYEHKPVENGNDYISICVKNPKEEEFTGYNEGLNSSFINYVYSNKIALIIDPQIEKNCEFRSKEETFMLPGERQVKDQIPFNYVRGISVMFDNENSIVDATQKIKDLLDKYNINLPIVDRNLEEINIMRK